MLYIKRSEEILKISRILKSKKIHLFQETRYSAGNFNLNKMFHIEQSLNCVPVTRYFKVVHQQQLSCMNKKREKAIKMFHS